MSGGRWDFQDNEISEIADKCDFIKRILHNVSETAHIIDWAESGDTLKEDAKKELYNLWKDFFDKRYIGQEVK